MVVYGCGNVSLDIICRVRQENAFYRYKRIICGRLKAKTVLEKALLKEKNLKVLNEIKKAILKSKSPSCGYINSKDKSCITMKKDKHGFTAQLFVENGIKIYTEQDIENLDIS